MATQFMSTVGDDLLLEIFLRLPNSRSAVRCSTVSKRWHSLISDPKFATDFIHHHSHRDNSDSPSPYTLICSYQRPILHQFLLHDPSKPSITFTASTPDLNFLPWPKESTVIRASFGDLLLVSSGDSSGFYCVCNPVTKQWVALPRAPAKGETFGLVCDASNCTERNGWCNCSIRFRVCLIRTNYNDTTEECVFHATIFCSETGRWSQRASILSFQPGDGVYGETDVVVSNGVLYWLLGHDKWGVRQIAAYDPFKNPEQARSIAFPEILDHWWQFDMQSEFLGVVSGHLRVSDLYGVKHTPGFFYKVWELDYDRCVWDLIHDRFVKKPIEEAICVIGFDPNDSNVVFFLDGQDVLRCKIGAKGYDCRKVCEFPLTDEVRENNPFYDWTSGFNVFDLVHPFWPTPLHGIPSLLDASLYVNFKLSSLTL